MTTGSFTDWAGTIADIGPIYPFVGSEGFLVIIGVVFWIAWHVFQLKNEAAKLEEEERHFKG
jgi:hypothetical protein